jgi:hypothetical protein
MEEAFLEARLKPERHPQEEQKPDALDIFGIIWA